MMTPKILVLIPTLKDEPTETVLSVKHQTISVSEIIVVVGSYYLFNRLINSSITNLAKILYLKPNMREPVGLRAAKALNYALSKVKIEDYDYILRVDADTKLPPNFVEKNLEADAEVVGKAGYAMLIKTESFLKVFNGRFPEVPVEDSFLNLSLMSRSKKVEDWRIHPILLKQSRKKHSWRYYFHRGVEMYKLGYEPIHVVDRARIDGLMNAFTILGYFISIIKRKERYEFFGWVFKTQLKRLALLLHLTWGLKES